MAKFVNRESLAQVLCDNLNISKKDASYAIELIFNEMSESLASDG